MKADIASCDLGVSADRCGDEYDRFATGRGRGCVPRGLADCAGVTPGLSRARARLRAGVNTSSTGQR